jgi:hypothetical protein
MIDDLRPASDDGFGGTPSRRPRPQAEEPSRPLADREVPLGNMEPENRVLASTVQSWLDGELPEASVRQGETARDVDFWKRVNVESERRRRMTTPAYLQAQIMEALPQTAPSLITPWHKREFVITPMMAVGAAAGVAAASAILTAVFMAL